MGKDDYYVGLDCGTNSVGWAVTDPEYNLLKYKKKSLWGARLFEEANTAKERRTHRSNRRREDRAKGRLKLLRMIFSDEISKVDPDFYTRLRESFYVEEDKNFDDLSKRSKNTLFNDPNFKDKDFHRKYPTIWHLRKAIIEADENEHFDIRLYYLAIAHILKNRGHFLVEGDFSVNSNGFNIIYEEFADAVSNEGLDVSIEVADDVEKILTDKKTGKLDKKKSLAELMFIETGDEDENVDSRRKELAGLICGSKISLAKLYEIESEDKLSFSFSDGNYDNKRDEIENDVGSEHMQVLDVAKQVYDFAVLKDILKGQTFISEAMVGYYNQHHKDLEELKAVLRPFKEDYDFFFRKKEFDKFDESCINYPRYIGQAYSTKGGRYDYSRTKQEDINKKIVELLEKHDISGDLLDRAKEGTLLPRQKGQAKGTIPQQLHHKELELILEKLQKDYPSFAIENADEPKAYNTKAKKIASIHSFRIPYYCGLLVKREFSDDGQKVSGGKSQFSWADNEIKSLVYPWNFKELVDLDQRANNFIRRMTNDCTYLIGEEVLPKRSLSYERYMVLNELNNLKVNGVRIDNDLKKKIYERVFVTGEISGNITVKQLRKYLIANGYISENDDLGGTNEVKILPQLKTHQQLKRILGEDYLNRFKLSVLEDAIEAITILGEDKEMLIRRLKDILPECTEDETRKLSKLSFKDYGKFSNKFLNGIRADIHDENGANLVQATINEALYETNKNLMELLALGFNKEVEENNAIKRPNKTAVSYKDVDNLYCSPAVKRGVWQAIRILKEVEQVEGHAPAKIFLEATRGENPDAKGKLSLSRYKKLTDKYKEFKKSNPDLINELSNKNERDLQSKKLYLYFCQMGRCAYTGERISLEDINNTKLYDIDHIYPRSKTADNSIENNLVLVKAEENRKKGNIYPLRAEIREKMAGTWRYWLKEKLITKEKYERLVRSTSFSEDELAGFVSRQIVETSQIVIGIRDLVKQAYPKTKVILVKAGQVSKLRQAYGSDRKDEDGNFIRKGKYEFIKIRDLNDFHHAKDAYLNIVVGNVMNMTFSDNPEKWIKNGDNAEHYSVGRIEEYFRDSEVWSNDGGKHNSNYPVVFGWNWNRSVEIISDTMKRNDCLWTRRNFIRHGAVSDLQVVGKEINESGANSVLMPAKRSKRFANTSRYGGYNKPAGAYFALIEKDGKNGKERQIVSIPMIYEKRPTEYVLLNYPEAKIILAPINYQSYMIVNGFPVHLAGKTNDNLILWQAKQFFIDDSNLGFARYLRNIANVTKKKMINKNYEISRIKDDVSEDENLGLFDYITGVLEKYRKMPTFSAKIDEILSDRDRFLGLGLDTQLNALYELLKVIKCNAEKGNLSSFVDKASFVGSCTCSGKINNLESVKLVLQSTTGIFRKEIDLKTVQLGDVPSLDPRNANNFVIKSEE